MSEPVVPDACHILDVMRITQASCMPAWVTADHVARQVRILPNAEPDQRLKDEIFSSRVSGPYGVTWEKPQSSVEPP